MAEGTFDGFDMMVTVHHIYTTMQLHIYKQEQGHQQNITRQKTRIL